MLFLISVWKNNMLPLMTKQPFFLLPVHCHWKRDQLLTFPLWPLCKHWSKKTHCLTWYRKFDIGPVCFLSAFSFTLCFSSILIFNSRTDQKRLWRSIPSGYNPWISQYVELATCVLRTSVVYLSEKYKVSWCSCFFASKNELLQEVSCRVEVSLHNVCPLHRAVHVEVLLAEDAKTLEHRETW